MKLIPLLQCPNLKDAVDFYTNVLDFKLKYPEDAENEWAVILSKFYINDPSGNTLRFASPIKTQ